jgi:hypothetical protein
LASTSNLSTRAAVDAVVDRLDLGSGTASAHCLIYSGTPPADADTALSGNTLLADLAMANPAFGAAADAAPGATATAGAITDDTAANATGTATFARLVDRDGTVILQVTVGTSGTELIINSAAIQVNATVKVTSLAITHPDA